MSNYNNSNNNLNNNNPNLSDLKYEFIKLKRNELLSLINTNTPSCDTNYKKLTLNSDSFFNNLYLLLTGYSASLVLVNLITDNVLHVYTNLFVLVLLLFNNNLISLIFKLFTVFILFLVKLVFIVSSENKCNDRLNNTLFLLYIVLLNLLFLLNFIANRYNLNNWNVNSRNRNRVSKVLKLFNTSELYAYLVGNLVFLSVIYFVVKLYTISYILIIIIVFLLLSRYRLTDLYNYKNTNVKSMKSFRKQTTSSKVSTVNYFPVVQNLITAFLLAIILFIIVFTLAPNNILYVNNYAYINKYITFNNYTKSKLLNRVKFLILYTFFVLLVQLVLVVMYLVYFFTKYSPLLNDLLYNSYYLFATVGSYDYNGAVKRLFLKDNSKNTTNLSGDTLREHNSQDQTSKFNRKLKVYLYYVDVHHKLVKAKPLWTKFTESKNFDDSDYVNKKLNKMYSKLLDKKNKLIHANRERMNENYFMKRLSTKFSNKFSSSTSKELQNYEEYNNDQNLLPIYEKHNSSVGCSYHYTNSFVNTYMDNFNNLLSNHNYDSIKPHTGEIFYYLQRYALLNHGEPSQFCLLSFHSSKKKIRNTNNYFNQNYLGLKFKLLQYIHEFNCYLYLYNNNLEDQKDNNKHKQANVDATLTEEAKYKKGQQNNEIDQKEDTVKQQNKNKMEENERDAEEKKQQKQQLLEQPDKLLTERKKNDTERENNKLTLRKEKLDKSEVYRLSIPSEYLDDTNRLKVTNRTDSNYLNNEYLSQRQNETQRNSEVQQLYHSSNNNNNLFKEKLLLKNKEENFNDNLLEEQLYLFEENKNNKLTERKTEQQETLRSHQLEETLQHENNNNKFFTAELVKKTKSNASEEVGVNITENNKDENTKKDNNVEENKESNEKKQEELSGKTETTNKKDKNKDKKKKTKYLNKLFNLKNNSNDDTKNDKDSLDNKQHEVDNSNNKDKKDDLLYNKVEQNTYEQEYVVNTSDSFTKLFSNNYNKLESSQLESNNRIKKLKLSNNYVNTYSYDMNFNYLLNKNNKPNTINKYDSSGTNLLTTSVPTTETKDMLDSQQDRDQDVNRLTERKGQLDKDKEYDVEENETQNNEEVDEKVNSIMNDLMKDLNLEF